MTPLPEAILRNHRRFVGFLKARVGDEATAEDILQAAYLRGLETASTIRDEESVVAWFYQLLRNAVIDHYRRRGAESRALEKLGREFEESVVPEARQEICECLHAVVGEIKDSYRRAVKLVDLDEVPLEEYARQEGISPNNASVRLHRARRVVASELNRVCGVCAQHGCLDCGCRSRAAAAIPVPDSEAKL